MWRLIYAPIWWLIYNVLIFAPLYLLGWVLIPIAAACKAYAPDPVTGLPQWTWPFMALYNNASGGVYNSTYWPTIKSVFELCVLWDASRNPVPSINLIPFVNCAIQPAKVGFTGSLGQGIDGQLPYPGQEPSVKQYNTVTVQYWFVSWCGWHCSWAWQFNWNGLNIFDWQAFAPGLYLIWLGDKIKPTDIWGVEAYRTPRTYCTIQFSRQGALV